MKNYYWQLPNGDIWGCAEGGWVKKENMSLAAVLSLVDDVNQLRERIRSYKGNPGELAETEDLCPGPDYELISGKWAKVRFSKLAFFGLFTMAERVKFQTVVAGANVLAALIEKSLMMADFIDVRDPATVDALNGLASDDGGQVLTPERAVAILAGVEYVPKT